MSGMSLTTIFMKLRLLIPCNNCAKLINMLSLSCYLNITATPGGKTVSVVKGVSLFENHMGLTGFDSG